MICYTYVKATNNAFIILGSMYALVVMYMRGGLYDVNVKMLCHGLLFIVRMRINYRVI